MPRIVKVKWDTSDGDWNPPPVEIGLPELIALPGDIEEEEISDWLSDKWGYCHFGWSYHSEDE